MFKKKETMKEIEKNIYEGLKIPEIKFSPGNIDLFADQKKMYNLTCTSSTSLSSLNGHVEAKVTPVEKKEDKDEWIWVAGYKGTEKDMKCRDYQFELGKKYDMSEDEEIILCSSGFHLCKNLNDVFSYYDIGNGHRYFKVNALVRKKDYDKYGQFIPSGWFGEHTDKLVAKSVEFVSEVSDAELIEAASRKYDYLKNMSEEQLRVAFKESPRAAYALYQKDKLSEAGYSEAFVTYLSKQDDDKIERALALASMKDLSMDVKVMCIFMED